MKRDNVCMCKTSSELFISVMVPSLPLLVVGIGTYIAICCEHWLSRLLSCAWVCSGQCTQIGVHRYARQIRRRGVEWRVERKSARAQKCRAIQLIHYHITAMLNEPMLWRPNKLFQHDDFSIKNCTVSPCVMLVSETGMIFHAHISAPRLPFVVCLSVTLQTPRSRGTRFNAKLRLFDFIGT